MEQQSSDNLDEIRNEIASAQSILGEEGSIAPKIAPPFYSRLQKAIEGLGNKPIPAEAVKNRLKKAGKEGFSEEEWAWSGMDALLASKKNVTRDELMKYAKENQIEVRDVMHGEDPTKLNKELVEEVNAAAGTGFSITPNFDVWHQIGVPFDVMQKLWPKYERMMQARKATKFATYQTQGGENYRELLMTLAPRDDITREEVSTPQGWGDTEGGNVGFVERGNTGADYRGSHWDEPNVLAHVRFNDRVGPSGEKILHIEEIQSDWHQTGREKGYGKSSEIPIDEEAIQLAGVNTISSGSVPDAPFKETWHDIAMKRMLRYAAENDYDRITLNPGQQINKILGGDPNSLEGQKQFYDKTLPNVMAKLGKPFGASISPMQIAGHSVQQINEMMDENSRRHYAAEEGSQEQEMFRQRANELYESLLEAKKKGESSPVIATSMPITPAMKESLLGKGMPMMSHGGDVPERMAKGGTVPPDLTDATLKFIERFHQEHGGSTVLAELPDIYKKVFEPAGVNIEDFKKNMHSLHSSGKLRLHPFTRPLHFLGEGNEKYALDFSTKGRAGDRNDSDQYMYFAGIPPHQSRKPAVDPSVSYDDSIAGADAPPQKVKEAAPQAVDPDEWYLTMAQGGDVPSVGGMAHSGDVPPIMEESGTNHGIGDEIEPLVDAIVDNSKAVKEMLDAFKEQNQKDSEPRKKGEPADWNGIPQGQRPRAKGTDDLMSTVKKMLGRV